MHTLCLIWTAWHPKEVLDKIRAVEGVLRVRVIK